MDAAPDLIDVVAAVIEEDGRILACRRAPHKSGAGLWEFPGGKVEPGETPEDALVREIAEELGVEIHVLGHLTSIERSQEGIRLICLRAELVDAEPTASTDHDAVRWVPRDGSDRLEWAPADVAAIRALTG